MYPLNTFGSKSLQQCLMLVLLVVSQQSGHITDSWIFTTLKTNKKIVMVNNTNLHANLQANVTETVRAIQQNYFSIFVKFRLTKNAQIFAVIQS